MSVEPFNIVNKKSCKRTDVRLKYRTDVRMKGNPMAALELLSTATETTPSLRPTLRLVPAPVEAPRTFLTGPLVAQRRAARARMLQRRRRTVAALALAALVAFLVFPGHAFGTTAAGLTADQLGTAPLQAGTTYTVHSGDTLASIAAGVNPSNPSAAYRVLVSELRTTSIVVGETIQIP